MIKSDLRVSKNINELSKDIKSILGHNEGFTIWQNINGNKEIIPGVVNSQYLSSSELTLEFEIIDSEKINPRTKVFMFNEASSMLLKGRIKLISKSKLKVLIDHKFYLKEKRTLSRIEMEKKNIHGNITRKIELKNASKSEDVRLKNINSYGCGFFISANRAVFFQPGSEVTIQSIEGVDISASVNGIISHVTPVEVSFDGNKLMLVGVKFSSEIHEIDTIIQEVEINLLDRSSKKLKGKTIG